MQEQIKTRPHCTTIIAVLSNTFVYWELCDRAALKHGRIIFVLSGIWKPESSKTCCFFLRAELNWDSLKESI